MKKNHWSLFRFAALFCLLMLVCGSLNAGYVKANPGPWTGPGEPEDPWEYEENKEHFDEFGGKELGMANGSFQRSAFKNANNAGELVEQHLNGCRDKEGSSIWFTPSFNHSTGYSNTYRKNSSDSSIGFDFGWGDLLVGAAFDGGHSKTTYHSRNYSSKDESDFYGLTLYADWKRDQLRIYGGLGLYRDEHDLEMNNIGDRLKSTNDTNIYAATLLAEYSFEGDVINVRPYTGIRYSFIDTDSYRVARGVVCSTDNQNIVRFPVGVKFDHSFKPFEGFEIKPIIDLSVQAACGDTKADAKLRSFGSKSSVESRVVDDCTYKAFLGTTAGWEGFKVVLGYLYEGSKNENTHGVTCGLELHF